MKKILAFLLLVSIFSFPKISSAITISTSDVSVLPGQINVPVYITVSDLGQSPIYGIDLILKYDPSLLWIVSVNKEELASSWNIASNISSPGEIRIALYGVTTLPAEGGRIAEIVFDVDEAALPGAASRLSLSKANFNDRAADIRDDGSLSIVSVLSPEYELLPSPEEEWLEREDEEPAQIALDEELAGEQEPPRYIAPVYAPGAVLEAGPEEMLEMPLPDQLSQREIETYAAGPLEEYPATKPAKPTEQKGETPSVLKQKQWLVKGKPGPLTLQREARLRSPEPARVLKARAKEIKRILIWRVYKLELEDKKFYPVFWKPAEQPYLPFLLRLNRREGTIYGIVWGKRDANLDLIVKSPDGEEKEVSCKLEIR